MTAFIGGALAYRARHHTTVEFLTGRFSPRWRTSVAIGIDLLILVAALAVGYVSLDLLSISATSNTPILDINAAWLVLPLTVGMALVALFVVERLFYLYSLRGVIPAAVAVAVLAGVVYAISSVPSLHFGNGTALGVMLVAFLLAVLLGLPVSFAMLLGSLTFLLISGVAPLIAVAQNTFDGTRQFHPADAAVLHLGRPYHGEGRHQPPPRALRNDAGRPHARRPAAGGGADDLHGLRHFRLQDRRRGRGWIGAAPRAQEARL